MQKKKDVKQCLVSFGHQAAHVLQDPDLRLALDDFLDDLSNYPASSIGKAFVSASFAKRLTWEACRVDVQLPGLASVQACTMKDFFRFPL